MSADPSPTQPPSLLPPRVAAVAHATLNREHLAEAKEQLALKEEELLRLRSELQT